MAFNESNFGSVERFDGVIARFVEHAVLCDEMLSHDVVAFEHQFLVLLSVNCFDNWRLNELSETEGQND
jgi:hypothetical protein